MRAAAVWLAVAFWTPAGLAAAQGPPAPMSPADLQAMRGGYEAGGLQLDFGAVVKTYVDGELALQSRLTWTPQGAVKTLEVGAATPDLADLAARSGLTLEGDAAEGLLVRGEGGATAVLHDLSSDRIANVVINNANNRTIRQATEITLNLPEFAKMSGDFASQRADLRLQDAVGVALRDAALR